MPVLKVPGDRVVGVSSYAVRPPEVKEKPQVCAFVKANYDKIDALEPFHPDRMASRILGMGDILSLVEQAQEKFRVDWVGVVRK